MQKKGGADRIKPGGLSKITVRQQSGEYAHPPALSVSNWG
ncbi:hypothetical protein BN440_3964 [Erwinia amylovora MR1]|nr:hypothetical protein BN440_3964 [Erwinia amylovora MR1]